MGDELLKHCIKIIYVVGSIPSIDRNQKDGEVESYYTRTKAALDGAGMGMPDYSFLLYSRITYCFRWAHLLFRPFFSFSSTFQTVQPLILLIFLPQFQSPFLPAYKQQSMTIWLDFSNCTRDALSLPHI